MMPGHIRSNRFPGARRRALKCRKAASDLGAAMVEFALIVPLLILFFGGVIDLGDAWFRVAAGSTAVRTAAVTGFDVGDEPTHDLRVLQTLISEAGNRRIENITKVIVFDATFDGTVPAACTTPAAEANHGVTGSCVVYDQAFLDEVRNGTAAAQFIDGDCNGSRDHRWCATDRSTPGGWWTGIYLEAEEEALLGLIPVLSDFTISESGVVREYPRVVVPAP